jgi:16S rRNA (guanine1207-N2)-methyltransferase
MAQYFDNVELESNKKIIDATVGGEAFKFTTDNGVFAKNGIDFASKLLVHAIEDNDNKETTLLDLGCGYGFIGIYLTKKMDLKTTFVDVNKKALELTEVNLELNKLEGKIIESDAFNNVDDNFDLITLNPPIHAGKEKIFELYEGAKNHLNEGGRFVIVINKKHGAKSSITKLETMFTSVKVIAKDKGFNVVECV